MTKSELVTAFAEEFNFSERKARAIIDTILDEMSEALARGEGIQLRGFGTFAIKHYEAYTGLNPKTLEHVEVKAKRKPVFKVGKQLKKAVDDNRLRS